MSTAHGQSHENSSTDSSGTTAVSINRHPGNTVDCFLTDLKHVVDDVFDLHDSTYSIDSTHVEAIQYNNAASWNYDPTADVNRFGDIVSLFDTHPVRESDT